ATTAAFIFTVLAVLLSVPTLVFTVLTHINAAKFLESIRPYKDQDYTVTFALGWTYFISAVSIIGGIPFATELYRRFRGLMPLNKSGYMPVNRVALVALTFAICWAIPVGINFKRGTPVPLDLDCAWLTPELVFKRLKMTADYSYFINTCNATKGWEVTMPGTLAAWALAALSALISRSAVNSTTRYGGATAADV
ncbi:hypothetical protein GQ42DRAFT_165046, partial [Ramicandelaber brevisporus]